MRAYRPDLQPLAREKRRALTEAELVLWQGLRCKQLHGVQFYRQRVIGSYIVDFYAPTLRLVVEVDGGQHLTAEGLLQDEKRTRYLESVGLMVVRFDNRQVLLETRAVLERIFEIMEGRL